jgi:hypothetical protein
MNMGKCNSACKHADFVEYEDKFASMCKLTGLRLKEMNACPEPEQRKLV